MPSSLPVPSKAALTALRGLVVGTSCTLALIAEDRRRKINNALRVIENSEKIKSARSYRAGGGALAIALEEEALWDAGLLPVPPASLELHQHNDLPTSLPARRNRKKKPQESIGEDEVNGVAEGAKQELSTNEDAGSSRRSGHDNGHADQAITAAATAESAKIAKLPLPHIPVTSLDTPRLAGPNWLTTTSEVLKTFSFPSNNDIIDKVHRACECRDSRQISSALQYVLEAMDKDVAPKNQNQAWVQATGLLCRTCQETGRTDDALTLLNRVIALGPLDESAYMDHGPLPLIELLLARAESVKSDREAHINILDAAIHLFLPTFATEPTGPNPEVYRIGRKLLECAFSANRLKRIIGVYRRCNMHAAENSDDLTSWFLKNLHEKHDHRSVVKIFLSTYTKASPSEASVHAIGDIIVDSVESAHNYRPADVLRALHSICSGSANTKLSPRWVMRLLVSHWKANRNLEEIEALFAFLQAPTLKETVYRSASLYRIMVELALEAGEEDKAESYFKEAVAQCRGLASDVRLLGVFARFHAKDGNWDAVRVAFEAMQRRRKPTQKAYGQVFVPVLKAYAEGHGIRETEAFMKSYIDELKVPLSSYMVTLMAKHYAAVRDLDSLVEWLDYCSRAGFPVDAAFTNAILVRCRKQWNFPFKELRTLFRKLRALNPDYVDKHTEHVMANAALSDSRYGGKAAQGRLLSLRIEPNKLPVRGKCASVEEVVLSMKEALTCNRPRRALWIYKRALHLGMPYSQQALRLAVQARLSSDPNGYESAYSLLRDPQEKGEDVSPIINYLLGMRLRDMVTPRGDSVEAFRTVEQTLVNFQRAGIRLTEATLHRAALTCLNAGHFQGAIGYALQAAAQARHRVPGGGPCFNLQNFRILLAAYAELVDVGGIRDTVARALASGSRYREDKACRAALSRARMRVMRATGRAATAEQRALARQVLDDALREVVRAREKLREQGRRLEQEALRIMRQAALDAGRPPVDFDEVPWLVGRTRKRELERIGKIGPIGVGKGGPVGVDGEKNAGVGVGVRDCTNGSEDVVEGRDDDPFLEMERVLERRAVDAFELRRTTGQSAASW